MPFICHSKGVRLVGGSDGEGRNGQHHGLSLIFRHSLVFYLGLENN